MQSNEFPYCCGIKIFSNFGNTNTALDQTKYTIEQIKEFLNTNERWYSEKALLLISINQDQYKIMKDILKEREYKLYSRSYHPNHNSYIYLFGKKNFKNGRKK